MTKIKGAIEVYKCFYPDAVNVWSEHPIESQTCGDLRIEKGIWLSHADLEDYVKERERKAFDWARKGYCDMEEWEGTTKHKTFEDFKKDSHE